MQNIFKTLKNNWKKEGPFKMLHSINPIRLQYIYGSFHQHSKTKLEDATVLDLGCGGLIASKALAKKVKKIYCIDEFISLEEQADVSENMVCQECKIEDFECEEKFDLIVSLEVIEHMDPFALIEKAASLLKKDGILIISTLNRTLKSAFGAIFLAEYILKLNPIGTHQYKKFVKPDEIKLIGSQNNLTTLDLKGMVPSFSQKWKLSENTNINYFITLKKIHSN
jgi:2-polyprenyl-6-hydroxyphenyl methylase / 3-demethylubiquinone-9 3-methyltransferase